MIQPTKQEKWQRLFFRAGRKRRECGRALPARGSRETFFYYWKKRLREAAARQFVEVQVGNSQLRPKHSRSALESTIEVRLSNGRSLIVPPEFKASHLRALLMVVELAADRATEFARSTGRMRHASG
jgi:hypothetical protein